MYTNSYKDTYYIYAHELTIDDGLGVCNPGCFKNSSNLKVLLSWRKLRRTPPKQINFWSPQITSPYLFLGGSEPFSFSVHIFFLCGNMFACFHQPPLVSHQILRPPTTPRLQNHLEELAHQPWWEDQFGRIGTMLWSFGGWCLHTPCLGGWNFLIPWKLT